MVNFNDILMQHQQRVSGVQSSVALQSHQKGTFDNKPLVSHSHQPSLGTGSGAPSNTYLTISGENNNNNQGIVYPQHAAGVNKTIDYTQPAPLLHSTNPYLINNGGKSSTLHNTPNSSHPGATKAGSIVMQSKAKVVAEPAPSKNLQSSSGGGHSTLH